LLFRSLLVWSSPDLLEDIFSMHLSTLFAHRKISFDDVFCMCWEYRGSRKKPSQLNGQLFDPNKKRVLLAIKNRHVLLLTRRWHLMHKFWKTKLCRLEIHFQQNKLKYYGRDVCFFLNMEVDKVPPFEKFLPL